MPTLKRTGAIVLAAAIAGGVGLIATQGSAAGRTSDAHGSSATRYVALKTMTGPGIPSAGAWVGDLGWVSGQRFYFADISNRRVDVFSTQSLRFITSVPTVPTGTLPAGIATVANTIWVGESSSTINVIGQRTLQPRTTILTHGTGRADELAWDPTDDVVMIGNPDDSPPFASFINVKTRAVLGHLTLPQATGIEQPVWDASQRMFFVSVPEDKTGEILGVSPRSRQVRRTYHLACTPSGLALGPDQQAAVACDTAALIINLATGRIIHRFQTLGGGDQIAYDHGLERYYITAHAHTTAAHIAVVDARTHAVIAHLPASLVTHSLGVDSTTHRVFVPTNAGVTVYSPTSGTS